MSFWDLKSFNVQEITNITGDHRAAGNVLETPSSALNGSTDEEYNGRRNGDTGLGYELGAKSAVDIDGYGHEGDSFFLNGSKFGDLGLFTNTTNDMQNN